MKKTCMHCLQDYEISKEDLAFYDHVSPVFSGKKYAIPAPSKCPKCRQWLRLAFRNHTALFERKSHGNGKTIYSMYPESAPFPVMTNDDWFSDKWDALDYGKDYLFEQPLMDQLYELYTQVPRYTAVNNVRCENSEYCHNVSDIKNCYLTFSTSYAEDCMYGESVWSSKDCIENTLTIESELCYDCINCTKCFYLQSSFNCENCSDSFYLGYSRNCRNCFGCVNLRNKQYCIWNEQKTKEEYDAFIKDFDGNSYSKRQEYNKKFEEMMLLHPRPHTIMHQAEDCTGNNILESYDVKESNFMQHAEHMKYCFNIYDHCNNCQDYTFFGRFAEQMYDCCSCGINVNHLCFCYLCRSQSSDLFYCMSCDGCKNCFGCVGLWRKEYCILNKQYTKEQYEELAPKIIEHMTANREWGEFFPIKFNATPYNRSIAFRYYPLTEEGAKQRGFSWYEEDIKDFPNVIEANNLPDGLPQTDEPITVKSALSRRPFRITTREIERYRQLNVPLPRQSYEERMNERAKKMGTPELYKRTCAQTGKPIVTPYPPNSPYIIWDRDEYENTFQ